MTFPPLTIGSVIALVVLLLGIFGMLGVTPFSAIVVFGMLSALALARLC
jgi:hypothetical protein